MSAQATPLLDQLAERDEAVRAARERVREVGAAANTAKVEAELAREALVEAYASGDAASEKALTKAKATAEARAAEPWTERVAGAERAAVRARGERDAWVIERIAALMAEIAPDAHAAVEAVANAAQALEVARREWHAVEGRTLALLRIVSPEAAQAVPQIPAVDAAVKDVLRATAKLPLPLPPGQADRVEAAHVNPARDDLAMEPGESRENSATARFLTVRNGA